MDCVRWAERSEVETVDFPSVQGLNGYIPSGGLTGVDSDENGLTDRTCCPLNNLPFEIELQSVLKVVPPLSVKLLIMARFVSASAPA